MKNVENLEYTIHENGKWYKRNFGNMKDVNGNKRGSIGGGGGGGGKCKDPRIQWNK